MRAPALRIRVDGDIELRLLSEQDAPALYYLVNTNRPFLRAWLPWIDFTQSVEDEAAFIRNVQIQHRDNNGFGCSIWYRGRVTGTIGYHTIDWSNRKVEIGYWIAPQFQGQGIMTRSCKALVDYAFDTLGLNKVEIRCATGNTRSCAIPQRLGFQQEGIIRQAEWLYDHYVDLVLYGLLVGEWRKQNAGAAAQLP